MGKIKIIGNLFTLIFAGSEVYTTFAAANTGVAQLVEHTLQSFLIYSLTYLLIINLLMIIKRMFRVIDTEMKK